MGLVRFIGAVSITVVFGLSLAQPLSAEFDRVPVDMKMPTGQSVAVECQDENADYPYTPYDWPDAKATLELTQEGAQSRVTIDVTGVKPDTYYTLWLRLKTTDNEGGEVGGNPILGIPGTPLIPSSELDEALTYTGPGNAKVGLTNGFWSDENGDAVFTTTVDYPIIGGAYPFHNFAGFDPADERFPLETPQAIPVAIANAGAPFTLRVASHCQSNVNYGLFPGPHEGWFDWVAAGPVRAQESVMRATEAESVGLVQMVPASSDAAGWDAWLVDAEAIASLVEAPSAGVREVEVEELLSLAQGRDAAGLERVHYWNTAAPSYRWVEVLADAYRSGPRNPAVFRAFALLNVGIYDATVATWKAKYAGEMSGAEGVTPAAMSRDLGVLVPTGHHPSFPSEHAAVAVVASEILAYLQPDKADSFRAMAEEAMASRLSAGANFRSDIEAGKVIGRAVAEEIIAWAKADGSDTPWAYTAPESTRFTVENPVFPMTGSWKTLAIENGRQFRAPPPPAYDSERVLADLEEIKAVERTLDTLHQASYWAIFYTGYEVWYDLASRLLLEQRTADNAPLTAKIYAGLGVAAYDAIVGCFDSKYAYVYARPSHVDASVEPLIPVPPHPSYPSAHSCGSGAMAHVITHFFPYVKDDVHQLAREAGQSRILAGIHYQIDNEAGLELGGKVGQVVVDKLIALTR